MDSPWVITLQEPYLYTLPERKAVMIIEAIDISRMAQGVIAAQGSVYEYAEFKMENPQYQQIVLTTNISDILDVEV